MYIFDTNSFSALQHLYPEVFKKFWVEFNNLLDKQVFSVEEVYKELENKGWGKHMEDWLKENKKIFLKPTAEEAKIVREIFSIRHFQSLIKKNSFKPQADPFIIALAKTKEGIVVTEEKYKKNSSKIPNVCEHFKVECINLKIFMKQQNWQF